MVVGIAMDVIRGVKTSALATHESTEDQYSMMRSKFRENLISLCSNQVWLSTNAMQCMSLDDK